MKTMMTRRAAILAAGASAPTIALSLAGCGTTSTTTPSLQIPAAVLAGLQAVATEITSVLPQLEVAGLPAATASQAQTYINDIQQVIQGLSAASSAVQGATVLSAVETYINTLAPIVLPFVSAVPGGTIIGMIVAALPAIEGAFNFFISLLNPQAQQVAASAPAAPASAALRAATPAANVYLNMLIAAANAKKASAKLHRR